MNWYKNLIKKSWEPKRLLVKLIERVEKVIRNLGEEINLKEGGSNEDYYQTLVKDQAIYFSILTNLRADNVKKAKEYWNNLDTVARDYLLNNTSLSEAQEIAEAFDIELNKSHWGSQKLSWEPKSKPSKELESKINILWSIYCAEAVLHIFEDKYPNDNRPRLAIEATKEYLKNPSEENKAKTQSTAYAAYASAADAVDAPITTNIAAAYAASAAADVASAAADVASAAADVAYAAADAIHWAKKAAEKANETIDFDALRAKAENDIGMYTKTSSLSTQSDIELEPNKGIKPPTEGVVLQPLTRTMMDKRQLEVGDIFVAEENLIAYNPEIKGDTQFFTEDHEYAFIGYTDSKWIVPGLGVRTDYKDKFLVITFDPVPKEMMPREIQWAEKFSVLAESQENKEQKEIVNQYKKIPIKILIEVRDIEHGIARRKEIANGLTEELHIKEHMNVPEAKKLVEDSFEFLDVMGYLRIEESGAIFMTLKGKKLLESVGE